MLSVKLNVHEVVWITPINSVSTLLVVAVAYVRTSVRAYNLSTVSLLFLLLL